MSVHSTVGLSCVVVLVVTGVATVVPLAGGTGTAAGTATATATSSLEVQIEETNSPVTEGETLTTYATVENTGNRTATGTVRLEIDGTERDTTDVTLEGGEATAVTLPWETVAGDGGEYTASVATDDAVASTPIRVERQSSWTAPPANFSVAIACRPDRTAP